MINGKKQGGKKREKARRAKIKVGVETSEQRKAGKIVMSDF